MTNTENRLGVTIIESDGKERQLITCNVCEYYGLAYYCEFCKSPRNENLPTRIHVPEIKITWMNKKIMEKWGKPIYTQG